MWYVMQGGAWYPVAEAQIFEGIARGTYNQQTMVRHDSWPMPQPLAMVPQFRGHVDLQARRRGNPLVLGLVIGGAVVVGGAIAAVALLARGGKSESRASHATARCDDVGDAFYICVEGSNAKAVVDGKPYLRVDLSITNSSHTPDDIADFADLDFRVEDAGGYQYGDDRVVEIGADQKSCSMYMDRLQPKEVLPCSVYFAIPSGTTFEDHVIVKHAGHEARLHL